VFERLIRRIRLFRATRAGLQIGEDCQLPGFNGWPRFGSEPYLISIGRRVAIAGGVVFITHDGGTWVFRRNEGFEDVVKYGRITIHDNCVIGYGAILLPGIEIGPNSVVAAGAVVGRSVPPNSLAAGVPARTFMTLDDYAKQSRLKMPDVDRVAYRRDKQAELLRIFPRPW
jgi:acetyltransferase-like isoleucine patch superfamily enzyme